MPGPERCPYKIRYGTTAETTTQCGKDVHIPPETPLEVMDPGEARHEGPGLAQFPDQRVTWLAGDRWRNGRPAMGDMDRLDYLLEQRADLMLAASDLLRHVTAEGRVFTILEQESFSWANGKADELGHQADQVLARLHERGYKPENRTRYVGMAALPGECPKGGSHNWVKIAKRVRQCTKCGKTEHTG